LVIYKLKLVAKLLIEQFSARPRVFIYKLKLVAKLLIEQFSARPRVFEKAKNTAVHHLKCRSTDISFGTSSIQISC
jgi:hypothetical protein